MNIKKTAVQNMDDCLFYSIRYHGSCIHKQCVIEFLYLIGPLRFQGKRSHPMIICSYAVRHAFYGYPPSSWRHQTHAGR